MKGAIIAIYGAMVSKEDIEFQQEPDMDVVCPICLHVVMDNPIKHCAVDGIFAAPASPGSSPRQK